MIQAEERTLMRNVLHVVYVLACLPAPAAAFDVHDVEGVWKLQSYVVSYEGGPPQPIYGAHPKGYAAVLPDGRVFVIMTGDTRKPGVSEAEQAALYRSLAAYSGRYRLEGNKLVTSVDVSWRESWNGTDQTRVVTIAGGVMTWVSQPNSSALVKGKSFVSTSEWVRDQS
jgi:hypothetical protein